MPINELLSTFSRRCGPALGRGMRSGSPSGVTNAAAGAETRPAEARLRIALEENKRLELALQAVRHTTGNHLAPLSAMLARQASERRLAGSFSAALFWMKALWTRNGQARHDVHRLGAERGDPFAVDAGAKVLCKSVLCTSTWPFAPVFHRELSMLAQSGSRRHPRRSHRTNARNRQFWRNSRPLSALFARSRSKPAASQGSHGTGIACRANPGAREASSPFCPPDRETAALGKRRYESVGYRMNAQRREGDRA